jgi:integrase/recombinase XerD
MHMNSENMPVTAAITLDKRRAKKDGTYPVRIFVWDSGAKKGKYYGTTLSLTEAEFKALWTEEKPSLLFKGLRTKLDVLKADAQAAIDQLEHFSFEAYERKVSTPKGEATNVFYHYAQRVEELKAAKQIGTASSYGHAAKSLQEYAGALVLPFQSVTPKFLQGFENYMVGKGRSFTTVGFYLRTLRAIYTNGVTNKNAKAENFPFGDPKKNKYRIPKGANIKKALTSQQLRQLMDAQALTPDQERARAFFFFSYASNGMNMKDIALLQWKQLEADKFTFVREKTKRTKKDNQTAITVYLSDFTRDIIARHGQASASTYVFPIVNDTMDADQQHRAVKQFTRYVNQHLEKLCTTNGLQVVSTYWARHSFATVAVLKGASMEFMRESLGHSDMKTTLNYFAGFDDEAKKELAVSIMDF